MNQEQTSESKFISLDTFVRSLRKEKISESSIESYVSDLKAFLQGQDISFDSIEHLAVNQIQQKHYRNGYRRQRKIVVGSGSVPLHVPCLREPLESQIDVVINGFRNRCNT